MKHQNLLGSLQYARGVIDTAERFIMNFPEEFLLYSMQHNGTTIAFNWECVNTNNGHPYKIVLMCRENGKFWLYLDGNTSIDGIPPIPMDIQDLDETWYNHNLANFRKV